MVCEIGASMKHYIEKLRRATWSYKQPLTHMPLVLDAPVSDLFVWRNSDEWETFFELTDLPALFAGRDNPGSTVTLIFFDTMGRICKEQIVQIQPVCRQTLSISEIIGSAHGSVGTFSVFHTHTPQVLHALGSNLTERGYVSYRYRGAPLRAYVHGNLDAIARLSDKSLQLLGGQSIMRREYNLQHALAPLSNYELFIVNPTPKRQRIVCQTLSINDKKIDAQVADLLPRGTHLFNVVPAQANQRVVISSHLIMARPLVFQIQDQRMDVFHG
jgi:hypothetical protein